MYDKIYHTLKSFLDILQLLFPVYENRSCVNVLVRIRKGCFKNDVVILVRMEIHGSGLFRVIKMPEGFRRLKSGDI